MRWKKSTQKLLSLVLTLAMLVSMVPSVFAAEGDTDADPVDEIVETAGPVDSVADTTVTTEEGDLDALDVTGNEGTADDTGSEDTADVAQIDGQGYATLAEAITAAQAGDTITLLADVELTACLSIPEGKKIILDLAGYNITAASAFTAGTSSGRKYMIEVSGDLTVQDPGGTGGILYSQYCIYVLAGGQVTITGGNISGQYAVTLAGNGASCTMTGGNVTGTGTKNYGIYGLMGKISIDISGGSITSSGAAVTVGASCAAGSSCTITGDPVITGGDGININSMSAVTLIVDGGTITGTGGTYGTASGISMTEGAATISGGTIQGNKYGFYTGGKGVAYDISGESTKISGNYAIYENCANNPKSSTISGGTFEGDVNLMGQLTVSGGSLIGDITLYQATSDLTIADGEFNGSFNFKEDGVGTLTVTGGTFSTDVSQYVSEGYEYDRETGEVTAATPVDTYVAEVNGTEYTTLTEAVAAVQDGGTITLLADVTNEDYDNVIDIILPAGATLDGGGHTLEGNIKVTVNAVGGTIQNVNFKNIHNSTSKLSAVYGSSLSGTLTVTGCTFHNCDWDALQITPVANANITITGNTFSTDNTDGIYQVRYVHIQSETNVDFSATVTENVMYDTIKGVNGAGLKCGALEIYYFTNPEKITTNMNYIEYPELNCILMDSGTNVGEMVYPMYADDTLNSNNLITPVAAIKTAYEGDYYTTLQTAVDAAGTTNTTITLLTDTTESVTINEGQNITLDLNGKTVKSSGYTIKVDGGKLTVKDSTVTAAPVVSDNYETVTYTSGKVTSYGYAAIQVLDGGSLTVASGTISCSGYYGAVYVLGNGAPGGGEAIASTATVNGGYIEGQEFGITVRGNGAALTVTDGVIVSKDNAAVGGNGANDNIQYYGGTTMNISGGTLIGHIQTSGYIACGIYHPQDGVLNITGGTIYADGGVGVLMRGGELNMTGGEVIASGTASGKVGDSTIIANCYGILLDGAAKYYDIANTKVDISENASVSAEAGVDALMVTDKDGVTGTIAVSGGTFSSAVPEEYCAEGFEPKKNEDGTFGVTEETSTGVAAIGDETYPTLQAAINAAQSSQTIQLLADVTESVTVPAGAVITLDLNGKTLTNEAGKDTITVTLGAELTVTGNGTVDNVSHQMAAVVNNGTTTLKGGSYTRSQEASTSTEDANGNSYYNILNHGVMTIEDGVSVTSKGAFSSLIDNGYFSYNSTNPKVGYVEGVNQAEPSLTITGGTFSGGINTIKNDDAATVQITGGSFSNVTQHVVLNWNIASIEGGTFDSSNGASVTIQNNGDSNNINQGKLTITGGTFTASEGTSNLGGSGGTTAVSGGIYSDPVELDYCADGYIPSPANNEGKYTVEGGSYNVAVLHEDGTYTGYEGNFALSSACYYLKSGETVIVLCDFEQHANAKPTIKVNATLDLNGHNVTGTSTSHPVVYVDKSGTSGRIAVTIKNGALTGQWDALRLSRNADVTLENVTLTGNTYGMTVGSYEVKSQPTVTVTGAETVITGNTAGIAVYSKNDGTEGAKVTIEDGVISGGTYGIAGNGSDTHSNDLMEITINGGTVKSTGTVGAAIYHPQRGTLTITGGTVEGPVGVQMCAGKLVVEGDPAIAATQPAGTKTENDGALPDGAAISIVNRSYPGGTPTATISGTPTVTATADVAAVQAYTWSSNTESVWTEAGDSVNISGGTYSTKPDAALLAAGYVANLKETENGYVVEMGREAFNTETQEYGTLTYMLENAESGQTVQLMQDVTADTAVVVGLGVTLDLNGKTLEAASVFAVGEVKDSANGGGLLKVGTTNGNPNITLKPDNTQLPLYDSDNSGYRLYSYTFKESLVQTSTSSSNIRYWYKLVFEGDSAYQLLKADGHGLEVHTILSWTETDTVEAGETAEYTMKNALTELANTVLGGAEAEKCGIYLQANNTDSVAGAELTCKAWLITKVGVTSVEVSKVYEVPANVSGS